MSIALKLDLSTPEDTSFDDCQGHWAEHYINTFFAKGYINGFEDGDRIIGKNTENQNMDYDGMEKEHWAYDNIRAAVEIEK